MAISVLILAGDTDGNLGDLAIITAICAEIHAVNPRAKISILTSHSSRDERRLGIAPIARGWRGFRTLLSTARSADLVICGGGGLFQDDDSLVKMPYWAIRLMLIRFFSGPITGLSIGAGPLDHWMSRFFARLAVRQLDPVSVRDPLAQLTLQSLTKKLVQVVPDPAFLLSAAAEEDARTTLHDADIPINERHLVGVSVRRWFHKNSSLIPYKYASRLGLNKGLGAKEMSTFVALLAEILDEVVEQTNAHIVFMPTYNVTHEADIEVCRDIEAKMTTDRTSILELRDPALYQSITRLLSVMLSGRMHSAILAAGQGTPVVGLAYNPKFSGMFALIEQEKMCISIDDLVANDSPEPLTAMLLDTIREPAVYRPNTSKIESRTREFIQKLVAPVEPSG